MVFKIITLWEFQVQQLTSTYTLTSFLHKLVDGNRERLDIVAELFSNQLCANSLQMETLVSLYSAHHDWYSYKTIAKLLPRFVLFIFVVLNKYWVVIYIILHYLYLSCNVWNYIKLYFIKMLIIEYPSEQVH